MDRNIPRTGKQARPKTAVKGKRYRCAMCHKRSPKAVKTPAPWYCPTCLVLKNHQHDFETDAPQIEQSSSA